jgi:hypothetical protein
MRMDGETAMWVCARTGGDLTDPLDVGYAITVFSVDLSLSRIVVSWNVLFAEDFYVDRRLPFGEFYALSTIFTSPVWRWACDLGPINLLAWRRQLRKFRGLGLKSLG